MDENNALTTTAPSPEPPPRLNLVALTPADVPAAQAQLIAWCDQQIAVLEAELDDFSRNFEIAAGNGWATNPFNRAMTRVSRTRVYYEKIKAALQAGYLIVPNFDVEVVAVRTAAARPRGKGKAYRQHEVPETRPDLSAVGVGRYVDPTPLTQAYSHVEDKGGGKTETVTRWYPVELDGAIAFPVLAVKPAVLAATERAMALKIFDQIGVVDSRKEDPVVVGRIIDPRRDWRWSTANRPEKFVSFFVAWWLDTRAL